MPEILREFVDNLLYSLADELIEILNCFLDTVISILALLVSIFALGTTVVQLYLQRLHNQMSLKPLGQIDLGDHKNIIYAYIRNYGMGPMIINKLLFKYDNQEHEDIIQCLPLDSSSYMHVSINKNVFKTVLPNGQFEIFEKRFYKEPGNAEDKVKKNQVRECLSRITVTVHYTDIYNNKYKISRNLNWFTRDIVHSNEEAEMAENPPPITPAVVPE